MQNRNMHQVVSYTVEINMQLDLDFQRHQGTRKIKKKEKEKKKEEEKKTTAQTEVLFPSLSPPPPLFFFFI